ncbi:MAG: DUF1499 domain-containing protein [Rhodospirillaceae bacterium]|nr:DUF1499 domain-containing protein [Rhodospirillaceae bacterium]
MVDASNAGLTSALARNVPRLAALGLGLAVAAALVAMLSGPLYQMKLIALFPAFTVLRYAVYAAIAGGAIALLSLVAALVAGGVGAAARNATGWVGLLVGLVVFYVPYSVQSGGYPPIHDVTTDIDDPPALIAAVPLRQSTGATNTPEYDRIVKSPRGNAEFNVPELQKKAFPDIQPVKLDMPPEQAFQKALDTVAALRWTLIEANAAEGRIEAWDKTAWFGFIDDVVIRVRADGAGSRVDVRSVSRIGFGDIGKNAKRIRAFTAKLTGKGAHG